MVVLEEVLENRIKVAYANFKSRVSNETHQKTMSLLESIHRSADNALQDVHKSTLGTEFAHALTVLDKIPDGSSALPTRDTELEARVQSDGQLLGTGKWELLDPCWLEAFEQWLIHLEDIAPFNTTPQLITIKDDTNIAVAGDWGTGNWRENAPSTKVGDQIQKLSPDYTIHLGDVYYAGTEEQEINNLVELWPMGKESGFTLNSNHEMYNGAYSYFQQALTKRFTDKKGCSYFALTNNDWLIIGLDSAYHSDKFTLYMDGEICSDQIGWLATLPQKKRTIILSHHQAYDITGTQKTKLYGQVFEGLGRAPDFWYWGHLHNAIVYKEIDGFYGRCIGHGAIPYGVASELNKEINVSWYETESAGDTEIPLRVMNGFALLTLTGDKLGEQLIDENGGQRFNCEHS